MKTIDYIVVGSGCTGAMAAQTLVEAGKQVTMLDVGYTDSAYAPAMPRGDFISLRKTDSDQYRYFIGDDSEGVAWGKVGKGEQVTPPRKHMFANTDRFLPVSSDTFSAAESLGYGGLGIGWGIGCWEWSSSELRAAGLPTADMRSAYTTVAKRIGISATKDDASAYTLGNLTAFQPSAALDTNHQVLYERFQRKQASLAAEGFVMGRAPLALLTQDMGERKAYSYKDMDFYSDTEQSAYRPWMTINALKKARNFTYIDQQLVLSFEEHPAYTLVHSQHVGSGERSTFRCKRLILAPGVLGSARIVLRSFNALGQKTPLLCNPYSYIPCVMPSRIGKEAERPKLGFAQLSFFLDESGANKDAAMASLYSYQSLMLFRMVRQVPLDFADARHLLRYLTSGLVIMGIHQPDSLADSKYLTLQPDTSSPTGDRLHITYEPTAAEQQRRTQRETKYMRAMRRLGAYPLKRIDPGFGSSIHYAGTLPYASHDTPLGLHPSGRVYGSRTVFVADGSGFTYLPAKGLTFSLMANAHRVAQEVLAA